MIFVGEINKRNPVKETPKETTIRLLRELDGKPLTSDVLAKERGCLVKMAASQIRRIPQWTGGVVYRSKFGGLMYGFASEAALIAFGVDVLEADAAARRRAHNVLLVAARNKASPARPGVDAGVKIKPQSRVAWANRPADMTQAKVTICSAPVSYSRTWIDPKTRMEGGFATMGIGRYAE